MDVYKTPDSNLDPTSGIILNQSRRLLMPCLFRWEFCLLPAILRAIKNKVS